MTFFLRTAFQVFYRKVSRFLFIFSIFSPGLFLAPPAFTQDSSSYPLKIVFLGLTSQVDVVVISTLESAIYQKLALNQKIFLINRQQVDAWLDQKVLAQKYASIQEIRELSQKSGLRIFVQGKIATLEVEKKRKWAILPYGILSGKICLEMNVFDAAKGYVRYQGTVCRNLKKNIGFCTYGNIDRCLTVTAVQFDMMKLELAEAASAQAVDLIEASLEGLFQTSSLPSPSAAEKTGVLIAKDTAQPPSLKSDSVVVPGQSRPDMTKIETVKPPSAPPAAAKPQPP